jgi:hypothetical protein
MCVVLRYWNALDIGSRPGACHAADRLSPIHRSFIVGAKIALLLMRAAENSIVPARRPAKGGKDGGMRSRAGQRRG